MRLGFLALVLAFGAQPAVAQDADLILTGARVWTGEPDRPWAEAVAIAGERILAVGGSDEVEAHAGEHTRVLDINGGFVTPGFIDSHTHFNRAGSLLLGANLLDVSDELTLVRRVREARDRLSTGAWIVVGDWGAYEEWAMGATGRERVVVDELFRPHRLMIDSITPDTPVLLSRWDRSVYLANSRSLEAADADCSWTGVECEDGSPTGRLTPAAAARIRSVIPPPSLEQRLEEARAAMAQLRELGVTTIHDNTPPDQLVVFQELHRRDELTVRVYARPTLDRWEVLHAAGIQHGFGDDWLRIGGLKGFVTRP